jgi:hypothetical protein
VRRRGDDPFHVRFAVPLASPVPAAGPPVKGLSAQDREQCAGGGGGCSDGLDPPLPRPAGPAGVIGPVDWAYVPDAGRCRLRMTVTAQGAAAAASDVPVPLDSLPSRAAGGNGGEGGGGAAEEEGRSWDWGLVPCLADARLDSAAAAAAGRARV